MIFLYQARLAILSQPKTGTTALDSALASRASIAVARPPDMKHINYRGFVKFVAPWIQAQTGLARKDYEIVSVMREPIDWLGSWYRFRTRERNDRKGNYTGEISFDQFITDVAKPKGMRPFHARLGSPCGVALNGKESIGVDRIFPYEDLSGLYQLIEERTEEPVETTQMRVSPEMELTLSDEARAAIEKRLAFALRLHASLRRDGAIDPQFRHAGAEADEGDE